MAIRNIFAENITATANTTTRIAPLLLLLLLLISTRPADSLREDSADADDYDDELTTTTSTTTHPNAAKQPSPTLGDSRGSSDEDSGGGDGDHAPGLQVKAGREANSHSGVEKGTTGELPELPKTTRNPAVKLDNQGRSDGLVRHSDNPKARAQKGTFSLSADEHPIHPTTRPPRGSSRGSTKRPPRSTSTSTSTTTTSTVAPTSRTSISSTARPSGSTGKPANGGDDDDGDDNKVDKGEKSRAASLSTTSTPTTSTTSTTTTSTSTSTTTTTTSTTTTSTTLAPHLAQEAADSRAGLAAIRSILSTDSDGEQERPGKGDSRAALDADAADTADTSEAADTAGADATTASPGSNLEGGGQVSESATEAPTTTNEVKPPSVAQMQTKERQLKQLSKTGVELEKRKRKPITVNGRKFDQVRSIECVDPTFYKLLMNDLSLVRPDQQVDFYGSYYDYEFAKTITALIETPQVRVANQSGENSNAKLDTLTEILAFWNETQRVYLAQRAKLDKSKLPLAEMTTSSTTTPPPTPAPARAAAKGAPVMPNANVESEPEQVSALANYRYLLRRLEQLKALLLDGEEALIKMNNRVKKLNQAVGEDELQRALCNCITARSGRAALMVMNELFVDKKSEQLREDLEAARRRGKEAALDVAEFCSYWYGDTLRSEAVQKEQQIKKLVLKVAKHKKTTNTTTIVKTIKTVERGGKTIRETQTKVVTTIVQMTSLWLPKLANWIKGTLNVTGVEAGAGKLIDKGDHRELLQDTKTQVVTLAPSVTTEVLSRRRRKAAPHQRQVRSTSEDDSGFSTPFDLPGNYADVDDPPELESSSIIQSFIGNNYFGRRWRRQAADDSPEGEPGPDDAASSDDASDSPGSDDTASSDDASDSPEEALRKEENPDGGASSTEAPATPTTDAPPATSEAPVASEPPGTTEPPSTTESPSTTKPPGTAKPPAASTTPAAGKPSTSKAPTSKAPTSKAPASKLPASKPPAVRPIVLPLAPKPTIPAKIKAPTTEAPDDSGGDIGGPDEPADDTGDSEKPEGDEANATEERTTTGGPMKALTDQMTEELEQKAVPTVPSVASISTTPAAPLPSLRNASVTPAVPETDFEQRISQKSSECAQSGFGGLLNVAYDQNSLMYQSERLARDDKFVVTLRDAFNEFFGEAWRQKSLQWSKNLTANDSKHSRSIDEEIDNTFEASASAYERGAKLGFTAGKFVGEKAAAQWPDPAELNTFTYDSIFLAGVGHGYTEEDSRQLERHIVYQTALRVAFAEASRAAFAKSLRSAYLSAVFMTPQWGVLHAQRAVAKQAAKEGGKAGFDAAAQACTEFIPRAQKFFANNEHQRELAAPYKAAKRISDKWAGIGEQLGEVQVASELHKNISRVASDCGLKTGAVMGALLGLLVPTEAFESYTRLRGSPEGLENEFNQYQLGAMRAYQLGETWAYLNYTTQLNQNLRSIKLQQQQQQEQPVDLSSTGSTTTTDKPEIINAANETSSSTSTKSPQKEQREANQQAAATSLFEKTTNTGNNATNTDNFFQFMVLNYGSHLVANHSRQNMLKLRTPFMDEKLVRDMQVQAGDLVAQPSSKGAPPEEPDNIFEPGAYIGELKGEFNSLRRAGSKRPLKFNVIDLGTTLDIAEEVAHASGSGAGGNKSSAANKLDSTPLTAALSKLSKIFMKFSVARRKKDSSGDDVSRYLNAAQFDEGDGYLSGTFSRISSHLSRAASGGGSATLEDDFSTEVTVLDELFQRIERASADLTTVQVVENLMGVSSVTPPRAASVSEGSSTMKPSTKTTSSTNVPSTMPSKTEAEPTPSESPEGAGEEAAEESE